MRTLFVGFIVAGLLATASLGQDTAREEDHQALRQLLRTVADSINRQDLKTLDGVFAAPFVFVAIDQTVITNAVGLSAYYARMFNGPDAPIASLKTTPEADILTQFIDANTGYCFGRSRDAYTLKNKQIYTFDVRWTAAVVKQAGQWKVASVHTGVNFLDNPFVRAKAMSFWRKLGVALRLVKPPYDVARD
jgi:hypothetical protein